MLINAAVALCEAGDPEQGLALLDTLSNIAATINYSPFWLARSELYQRLGDEESAQNCLKKAIDNVDSTVERRFLEQKYAHIYTHMG